MKKIFCLFLAIIFAMSFVVSAFAFENERSNAQIENKPVIKYDFIQSARCEKTFSIMVSAENIVGLDSAVLEFHYDPNIVEFSGIRRATSLSANSAGGCPVDGLITFSIMYSAAVDSDKEDLCVIDFIILETGVFELNNIVLAWDGISKPENSVFLIDVYAGVDHENTIFFEEEIIDNPGSCYDTLIHANTYCNDCESWLNGYITDEIVVHRAVSQKSSDFEYYKDSCVMKGYTDGEYCDECDSWISGHEEVIKVVHIDNNKDRVCDYCEAYIGIPDVSESPEIDDETTDNESDDAENIGGFNSIIEMIMKLINFIKKLLGL